MKVAIVGTAPSWNEAPYGDESWEIWGLARGYTRLPRWSRWFELHALEDVCRTWGEFGAEDPAAEAAARSAYVSWLADATRQGPVYLREPRPEVPNATVYPVADILARFPRRYFTNTVSWMIALAIHEGADEIGLYGVNMELSGEYAEQRPSCEYFVGVCDGAGIPLHLPESSTLLRAGWLYGIEDPPPVIAALQERKRAMEQKTREQDAQSRSLDVERAAVRGATEMLDWTLKNWAHE